jgi:hypothetical protein
MRNLLPLVRGFTTALAVGCSHCGGSRVWVAGSGELQGGLGDRWNPSLHDVGR